MDVIEEEMVRATQSVMRSYRQLLALLSEVVDAVVAEDEKGNAIAHIGAPLAKQIRRVVHK